MRRGQRAISTYAPRFATDWNRSAVLLPDGAPRGAVVLIHGMTDAPFSLRHLATLLLHLAGQPGAAQLAPWVTDLKGETEARSRDRGAFGGGKG